MLTNIIYHRRDRIDYDKLKLFAREAGVSESDSFSILGTLLKRPKIKELDFQNYGIKNGHIVFIFLCVKYLGLEIEKLNLDCNITIDKDGCRIIAENMPQTIHTLSISKNKISNSGFAELVRNTSIRTLILKGNHVTSMCFREIIANGNNLTHLDVSANPVSFGKHVDLVPISNIRILDISKINRPVELIRRVAQSTRIHTLSLAESELLCDDIEPLSKMWSLRNLDLSSNLISDKGVALLASNKSIRVLNLRDNIVVKDGFKALGESSTIRVLDLSYNFENYFINYEEEIETDFIDGDTIVECMEFLVQNKSIIKLNLNENNIGNRCAEILARNASIRYLNLSNNFISDEGAKALARNTAIRKLDLSNNEIGDLGAKFLARSKTLDSLIIKYNYDIGSRGISAFQKTRSIRSLSISWICPLPISNNSLRRLFKSKTILALSVDSVFEEKNNNVFKRYINHSRTLHYLETSKKRYCCYRNLLRYKNDIRRVIIVLMLKFDYYIVRDFISLYIEMDPSLNISANEYACRIVSSLEKTTKEE